MSSTEPPSRNAPRNQPHDTKAARNELSSKGKVEKVREIDADEQTRKRKFLQFYKDERLEDEQFQEQNRLRPADLMSGKTQPGTAGSSAEFKSSHPSSFGDEETDIVPNPAYTAPPDVGAVANSQDTEGNAAATEEALPQSKGFWQDWNLPDQPLQSTSFQQTSSPTNHSDDFSQEANRGDLNRGDAIGNTPGPSQKGADSRRSDQKSKTARSHKDADAQDKSPSGLPGMLPIQEPKASSEGRDPRRGGFRNQPGTPSVLSKGPADPSGFGKTEGFPSRPRNRFANAPSNLPEEEQSPSGWKERSGSKQPKHENEEISSLPVPDALPLRPQEGDREESGSKDRNPKTLEIQPPSLPGLPPDIQPAAAAAAAQAAPYLSPAAASLFFQMVGTMYIMTTPAAVNRTEIVLNNPAYADSKFYGSTITIEKYATAPDSFNIRLTGSQQAVAAFKENIPSLMTAFQNGNFSFRVNRLDAEYTIDKPVFRRREKGEDGKDSAGGDLGERRK